MRLGVDAASGWGGAAAAAVGFAIFIGWLELGAPVSLAAVLLLAQVIGFLICGVRRR